MSNQIALFPATSSASAPVQDFDSKLLVAQSTIRELLKDGYSLLISSSFGKDSSVCCSLVLNELKQLVDIGVETRCVHILNVNTGYENPLVDVYVGTEIRKIKDYICNNNLPAKVWESKPSLSNDYLVNMVGGRTVASMPGADHTCQQMLKASPLKSTRSLIMKTIKAELATTYDPDKIINIVGTRFDESESRAANMKNRKENNLAPVKNESLKEWTLSPIAEFTYTDVYQYIGMVRSNLIPNYSDYDQLVQVYRDSEAGECMINIYSSGKASGRTNCNARHGCWLCTQVGDDKSMENMLQNTHYAWMQNLNDFRNYLAARHYDLDSRCWLSRKVDNEGRIRINPVAYSPEFCLDLLRYLLTIDAIELESAQSEELDNPRFQCLTQEKVIAIDLLWSRYGYQKPLQACREYHEIHNLGKRYPTPKLTPHPRPTSFPEPVFAPFADDEYHQIFNGFRDITDAATGDEDLVTKQDHYYKAVEGGDSFTIDKEGVELFFGFELEYALKKTQDEQLPPSYGVHFLMNYGFITIHKGSYKEWDRMLKVSNQIHRHGLRKILNKPKELYSALGVSSNIEDSQQLHFVM